MPVGVATADGKIVHEPHERPITLHDLFRHAAGLTCGGRPGGGSAMAALHPSGGGLDGKQVLSPQTVAQMTSNHLDAEIQNRVANVEPHRAGDDHGYGLGVAVHLQPGVAAVPGNLGESSWNGANGTGFFCDPKAQLVVAVGNAAPGDIRKDYREQVQNPVYGAMTRQGCSGGGRQRGCLSCRTQSTAGRSRTAMRPGPLSGAGQRLQSDCCRSGCGGLYPQTTRSRHPQPRVDRRRAATPRD